MSCFIERNLCFSRSNLMAEVTSVKLSSKHYFSENTIVILLTVRVLSSASPGLFIV